MPVTRDNHYVPQWYQRGFLPDGKGKLHYLNLNPEQKILPDGRVIAFNAEQYYAPARCFYKTDLYSTFFGPYINDEIERKLFGQIDDTGSRAVKAFLEDDPSAWHRHFQDFFYYLDAQKIRTQKGLDWIAKHYANLNQNSLMREMQGLRNMHCTLWTEGVREIVSARDSGVKFIVSDHPVTVYNYACPPGSARCAYPDDPPIALKATQTIYPLDADHCLILTNLEYAEKPDLPDPLSRRTFPRNFRNSMVRTDKFIRKRSLSENEVTAINLVLKARARRYVAAGEKEFLYPERQCQIDWPDIRQILLPPKNELWHYGGELFAKFDDGSVYYQDAFGRTSPKSDHLEKKVDEADLGPNSACGCGSGKKYKQCCRGKPPELRPSWSQRSIRERNMFFFRGLTKILGLDRGKDWNDVRRELGDDQVREIHELNGFLWPADTEVFALLPKPDGATRAVFSGLIDPRTTPFVIGNALLYFDEIIVQNPFLNPGQVNKKFNPVLNPRKYRLQTLRNAFLLMHLMPAIEAGYVNLVPDLCSFDNYLQRQMLQLAQERSVGIQIAEKDQELFKRLQKEDFNQMLSMLPRDQQERMLRRADPSVAQETVELVLEHLASEKDDDPLALLQEDVYGGGEEGGQLNMLQMSPNFEMLLLIAQATGSFLLTDSHHRWGEIRAAQHGNGGLVISRLPGFEGLAGTTEHSFLLDPSQALELRTAGKLGEYRKFVRTLFGSIQGADAAPAEAQIVAEFERAHAHSESQLSALKQETHPTRIIFLIPQGGFQHNNAQRMLITTGVENYRDASPMAVLIET